MKRIIQFLASLLLLLTGMAINAMGQNTVTVGTQLTEESQIVSGKAYLVYYVGNADPDYMKDTGSAYTDKSDNNANERAVYIFTNNGDGTWTVKNYYTGKYWGTPTANANSYIGSDTGGNWALNFQANGNLAPSCNDHSWNRSGSNIHPWSTGTAVNNQFRIYEVADAGILTPPIRVTSGWYLIQWVDVGSDTNTNYTNEDVSGKYVRNYPEDVTVNANNYPLYLANEPTTTDEKIASLVYFGQEQVEGNAGVSGYLRSANGHYVTQSGATSLTASSRNYIIYNSRTSYPNNSVISSALTGSGRKSLVPMGKGATPYIGQTVADKYPMLQFYAIGPILYNLVPWSVVIVNGSENEQITYTGSDASGLTSVYNGGTFFLTSGVTPSTSDFTYDSENKSLIVDEENHRIIVAPSETLLASDVTIIQGNETTGKGNTMQALLRLKVTPTLASTPTALALTFTGVNQLSNVAIYRTTGDELRYADATPVKISNDITPAGTLNVPLTTAVINDGETAYLWVTADVKSNATEWATIDATITSITYTNMLGETGKLLDLTSVGNPDGVMRIYKQQTPLWTPSHANTTYYRIPTMINTADGGIVALADYRHDHPYDLGKNASNGAGPHVIDVVSRRSTDGGLTWQSEVTVAAGDGSTAAGYGYGDPAIVRDADGTLHCLMAAGSTSYASGSGMLHMGYSKSTDNGATWSTVTDIYNNIDKDGLTIASAFTTGGKGVTFTNGRMAFAFLGKVSETTNVYPLYSDDKGVTWKLSSAVAYGGGDESKLEIMNDNSLLLSVRKGGFNGTALRAHNRTTGDASANGIGTWGTAANWGSEMNANGCNADILYYSRATENPSRPDVLLHTLTKSYSTYRKDLRLYMSFDEGATWTEAFQLQPGYAAYSSMQKLANGDLAIIYEDGSIGNQDKQDCYAMNYVVMSKELIEAKIDELYNANVVSSCDTKTVFIVNGTTGEGTYGSTNGNTWTSNASSGQAGLKLTKSDGDFNKFSNWNSHYNLAYRPGSSNNYSTLTLESPNGYIISGYSFLAAKAYSQSHTYTIMTSDNTIKEPAFNAYTEVSMSGLNTNTEEIKVKTTSTSYYLAIADFTVTLEPVITLHQINGTGASYATLYMPYKVTLSDDVKAYSIGVDGDVARLTEIGQTLPAYTPAVLISETGVTTSSIAHSDASAGSVSDNALMGTLCQRSISGYVLNAVYGVPGFYKLENGSIGANKAFLPESAVPNEVKGLAFMFDETGIESIQDSRLKIQNEADAVYDLSGRKVSDPTSDISHSLRKGLYIRNGRKLIIR